MSDGAGTAEANQSTVTNISQQTESSSWWNNPYLLGSLALTSTAVLSLSLSLLLVCHRLHHFNHCSLFLIEMAVGSLTSEAIVHLLPAVILTDQPSYTAPTGMPAYFPRLVTVAVGVCLLHALDTASIVFYGRRQSISHAMEWQNNGHQHGEAHQDGASDAASSSEGGRSEGGVSFGVRFADEQQQEEEDNDDAESAESGGGRRGSRDGITLRQVLANPRRCMQPGPYRLCSILSAGSVLHSFADGVAIGAAFVKSWESGLHLSLSVGTHELAHKVADFSVLTASGFSLPVVLLLNVCYWTSAFLGLFVSVPLSQKSEVLRAWIVTIATSVFVYISLVTMSSMVRKHYLPKHISAFVIGNLGMTTGFVMIMLASVLGFYF